MTISNILVTRQNVGQKWQDAGGRTKSSALDVQSYQINCELWRQKSVYEFPYERWHTHIYVL